MVWDYLFRVPVSYHLPKLILTDIDGGVLTKNKDYTIVASDIISATINTDKTKTDLKMGTDYEIADYSNNLKKGTATVTFKGIGAYAGEKTVKFKIDSAQIE